jgi:transketolase
MISTALVQAKTESEAPTVIIAHTIKGKGVSFMENEPAWHGSVRLRIDEAVAALRELDCGAVEIRDLLGMDITTPAHVLLESS